jgi:two-component system sensor histidine kinase KdpD
VLNPFTDGLIFLIANTFIAILGGFVPSVLAALLSTALLNYYFIPPLHAFTISERNNVIALLVFLVDALIISTLVQESAKRSRQAREASRESSVLSALAGNVLRGGPGIAGLIENARKVLNFTSLSLVYKPSLGSPAPLGLRESSGDISRGDVVDPSHFEWGINQSLTLVGGGRPLQPQDSRVLDALSAQLEMMWERELLSDKAKHADELVEADRMRSALLSAVSHDLRGPLASALASVSSLRNESVQWSDENRRGLLETAEASLDRLNKLIENLLDMSRLQAGALAIHIDNVSFQDLLPQVLESIPISIEDINLSYGSDLPEIRTDSGLLERALANLISNAMTHGSSTKKPSMTLSQHGPWVQIRIIDYGAGIDLSDPTKIFTPFRRLGDSNNKEGVGLGLALSKGLVESIGGTLILEDTPGGGLTVVVSVPLASKEKDFADHA